MSFHLLTPPRPFYRTEQWLHPEFASNIEERLCAIELAFVASSGRPVKDWAVEAFKRGSTIVSWLLTHRDLEPDLANPLEADLENRRKALLHLLGAPSWLAIQLRSGDLRERLESVIAERWRQWFGPSANLPRIRWQSLDSAGERAENLAWAGAMFPAIKEKFGEKTWIETVDSYLKETRSMSEPAWDAYRFLPGVLRQRGHAEEAELAALEWARCQAVMSPQDEAEEKASLRSGEVIRNPSAQIVQLALRGEVLAIVRHFDSEGRWSLSETPLSWMDGALLDAAEEGFRSQADELLRHVEAEHPEGSPLRKKSSNGASGTFAEKLEALVRAGILLKG